MTVTFNASASTAGGSKDAIATCEWNFGDGTPKINQTTFTTTHVFAQVNNYNVTLNVTNTQGLWSVTSNVLVILPPDEPTADFMWYPATPKAGQTVIFDATMSRPGCNGTHYPPILNYTWDFGGNNFTSVENTTITHEYKTYGDFNVTLKVTDANGLSSNVTKTVRVRVIGLIGDVNGDGMVDIYDAILVAASYGSSLGGPNWNSNADFNSDGMVDIYDAIMLSGNFGKIA
jgi:PKD repeat protein